MKPKAAYHHGELRGALIDAALAALERDGAQALSLRGLARSVGVSPMAPYHHFADRAELLAAIAAEGFRRLQASKERALADAGSDPAEGLVAGTVNYVVFMIDNPNLHRLMHEVQAAGSGTHAELAEAAAAPAASLLALVRQFLADHASAYDARLGVTAIWAFAHGLGTLVLSGQLSPAEAQAAARSGAAALIRGWLAG